MHLFVIILKSLPVTSWRTRNCQDIYRQVWNKD